MNKKLFIGTVPTNKKLFIGTIPLNKKLFIGTGPVNKKLFIGTVPMNNFLFIGTFINTSLDNSLNVNKEYFNKGCCKSHTLIGLC